MAFWDAVSRGMDKLASKLDALTDGKQPAPEDTGFSVMDKDYCWEDLDYAGEDTLQRHVVSGECRIVDKFGMVVDRGTQAALEQAMIRRSARIEALRESGMITNAIPPSSDLLHPVQAKYGDIIGVVRSGGMYEHYGIYVSDTCVIHYNFPETGGLSMPTIHATSLRFFLMEDKEYFILDFPRPYEPPVRIGNQDSVPHTETVSEEIARHLRTQYGYHLYTPEETVARAKSRLGEKSYNFFTNNCEHFAIWCKTGVSESLQVTGMLHSLLGSTNFTFRRTVPNPNT